MQSIGHRRRGQAGPPLPAVRHAGRGVATGLLIALFDGLAAKAFGYEFQGAIGFNSISGIAEGSTEAAVGASPWFTALAGILTNNVLLAIVIMATFVAWIWFWVPAEIAYTTRTMIAWSFDRLAPDRLGYVSPAVPHPGGGHRHVTAGSIVFMWLIAYRGIAFLTPDRGPAGGLGGGHGGGDPVPADPAGAVRGLAGGRLPDRPGPGDVVAGASSRSPSSPWCCSCSGTTPSPPARCSPSRTVSREFWIVLGIVVFGVAWFLGTRLYRRRQGIDVDLAFRQIPIE